MNQPEKRHCERLELNRSVKINLTNGHSINGATTDISLGGIKVSTTDSVDDALNELLSINNEQVATVQIKFDVEQYSDNYPCTIVRHSSNSVSLEMDRKKAAAFSIALTRGTLKRK